MNILAFDSSSSACSAAVLSDGKIISDVYINNTYTHSTTLLPAVKNVLTNAGLEISDIDKIAVTVGPGSFTGVKIGLSTAKGLAFGNNIDIIPVSSLAATAYNLRFFTGSILAVMDARRSSYYNALFHACNGKIVRKSEDRQSDINELIKDIKSPSMIVGDGADSVIKYLNDESSDVYAAPEEHKYINASSVAALAYELNAEGLSHMDVHPVYLRVPQAERERLERLKIEKNNN